MNTVCHMTEPCLLLAKLQSVSWLVLFAVQRCLTLDSTQSSAVGTCCTFNHNGQLLVVGCSDGVVRIFDLRRSDCIDSWMAHQGEALAIQLTADFTVCYTLGSDGKASCSSVYLTGCCRKQSPSLEIDSCAARQEVCHILVNPGSLTLLPILSQMNPVHALPSWLFMVHFNIIFPFMRRSCKWPLFKIFPSTTHHAFFFSPCMPHVLPMSSPLIWWLVIFCEQLWSQSSHYVIFSICLLLFPSQAQISSPALYSWTTSACVPLLV